MASIHLFDRELKPHVPDAWINTAIRDEKDGEIGKVGYEINFNRYFYQYTPPRPLEENQADIREVEQEIMVMLREMMEGDENSGGGCKLRQTLSNKYNMLLS
jgi:type I restriction enzyme M protein